MVYSYVKGRAGMAALCLHLPSGVVDEKSGHRRRGRGGITG
jgi:hypothetical protein